MVDSSGRRLPCQILEPALTHLPGWLTGLYEGPGQGRVAVGFMAADVPGFGYKAFRVEYGPAPRPAERSLGGDGRIENEFFVVSVNAADGTEMKVGYFADEGEMINAFWRTAENHRLHLVGANILNFDLPYLMRRSMEFGVKVPIKLNLRRYQVDPICDLMQILAHWGSFRFKPLKWHCERYGIPIPMPDIDGSMVKDLEDVDLAQYVASDVWITRELWRKMDGIYWPPQVNVPNPYKQ